MGCSSSSAQTVEQEKRPGTKPEESNGETAAVRNGIIAEDVQTIEDQMQLPVETALPNELKSGPEDETEAVLVAMEAQEDLGSGEDLLSAPEPQSASSEDSAEPEDAVTVTKGASPVEEALPIETAQAESSPKVKALDAKEETVEAKYLEALQTDVLAEVVDTVPVAEAVVEGSTDTEGVVEKAFAEAASKAPTEDAEPVKTEAPTGNTATVSETPSAGKALAATTVSEANEQPAPAEPSETKEAVDLVIDTTIAETIIPMMPPVNQDIDAVQAKQEEPEVSTAITVTASASEVSCPEEEVQTAPEPTKTSEAPPVTANLDSSTEARVVAEVHDVKANTIQTEDLSDPDLSTEPIPETSSDVASVNEASKDTEGEIAKKQD